MENQNDQPQDPTANPEDTPSEAPVTRTATEGITDSRLDGLTDKELKTTKAKLMVPAIAYGASGVIVGYALTLMIPKLPVNKVGVMALVGVTGAIAGYRKERSEINAVNKEIQARKPIPIDNKLQQDTTPEATT